MYHKQFDLINAAWYWSEGTEESHFMAVASLVAAIPGIGDMLGLGLRGAGNVAKLLKYTNAATKLSRGGKLLSAGCRVIGAVAQTGVNAINFSKALDTVFEEMETNGGTASWQANANLAASAIGVLIGVRQSFSSSRNFSKLRSSFEGGSSSSNPFYKQGGGSNLDDFMTPHAQKHAYNPNVKSTKNKTQFGENIDAAKLREDTMLHSDKVIYDSEHNIIMYVKEYDFNISTSDTPTGSHRVVINLAPKAGKTNRNSQFPYYGGDK